MRQGAQLVLLGVLVVILDSPIVARDAAEPLAAEAEWIHSGPTSAVIAWRLNDIAAEARGYVEYGPSAELGRQTEPAEATRWIQSHRLTGLAPGEACYFRLVIDDGGEKIVGQTRRFTPDPMPDAIAIEIDADGRARGEGVSSGGRHGAAVVLDKPGATYVLAGDVTAEGTGIVLAAEGITLEMDGHTVTFATRSDEQVFGVVADAANVKVFNGRILQGDSGGEFCYAFAGRRRVDGLEVAGLYCEVNGFNAYAMNLFGAADGKVHLHHNEMFSQVEQIQSRHYPGNDILRVDPAPSAEVDIHDNLLTEGCHRAITFMGKAAERVEIHHNDIRHHMRFTNGYAFNGELTGAKIFRNRITSIGRTAHLTAPRIEFYENWASTKGHMERGDMPQGSDQWQEIRVELHGIKFEGPNAREIKVHHNFMRTSQPQPDDEWDYVAVTTLNLGARDANAMNEIYNNRFVAHTSYQQTRRGGYGNTGNWAGAVHLVTSAGPPDDGKYYAHIHDNEFVSNDVMFGTGATANPRLGLRVENNTFKLGPDPTDTAAVFHQMPEPLRRRILDGENRFERIEPD